MPQLILLMCFSPSLWQQWPHLAFSWRGVLSTSNQLPHGWKHSPTICHGLIQTALEEGEASEHLQYIDVVITWDNTAEDVFEKGKKIVLILLKTCIALKQSKAKGPAHERLMQASPVQGDCCMGTGWALLSV